MAAIYILQPDAAGTCCDCSVRVNPCDLCTGDFGGFQCRTKGGTALLCGAQGFVETNPTQYYATITAGGHVASCHNAGDGIYCGAGSKAESRFKYVYHGSTTTDCVNTVGEILVDTTSEILPCCSPCSYSPSGPTVTSVATFPPSPDGGGYADITLTETRKTWDYDGHCVVCAGYCSFDGQVTLTLSEADSDSAAIARLLATVDWTDWTFNTTCLAVYQARTIGNSIRYEEAQWRLDQIGFIPNTVYQISMPIYRRVYDVGDYVLYQTVTGSVTSDSNGRITSDPTDIPNAEGFQTYADFSSATVTLP